MGALKQQLIRSQELSLAGPVSIPVTIISNTDPDFVMAMDGLKEHAKDCVKELINLGVMNRQQVILFFSEIYNEFTQ